MTEALGDSTWRFEREDWKPLLWIIVLPLLFAGYQLVGWIKADPLIYTGWIAEGVVQGVFRGVPFTDPNNGFSTQALGVRAALEWLAGNVPWWNYYSGVGLP